MPLALDSPANEAGQPAMRRLLPGAKVGHAAVLIAALLLVALASSAFHGHDLETSNSCAACLLAGTPGDTLPAIGVAPRPTDVSTVWVASWRPLISAHRAALGARAPPASS